MICKNCKRKLEQDALYCTYCGKYTGRHPRTQNPIFLKRVIAWLVMIIAILTILCIILGMLALRLDNKQKKNDLLPSFTEETPTDAPTLPPTPTALVRGEDVTADYSISDKKKLNMVLSTFSFSGVEIFSQEGGDADMETMLKCAFMYCKRNKKSSVGTENGKQYISDDLMKETMKQLFGIVPDPESVGSFTYEKERYYTSSAKKTDTTFAQLTAIYKNADGTYTVDLDIYDYGDEAFSSEFYTPKNKWSKEFNVKRIAQATAVINDLSKESGWSVLSYQQENI